MALFLPLSLLPEYCEAHISLKKLPVLLSATDLTPQSEQKYQSSVLLLVEKILFISRRFALPDDIYTFPPSLS